MYILLHFQLCQLSSLYLYSW